MATDNRDKIMAVVGIMLIVFAMAFLIPVLFVALETPEVQTFTQAEDEEVHLTGDLTAILDTVSNNQVEVNVTLIDEATGEKASTGIITSSTNVTIGGETVTVTLIEKLSNSEATIRYTYPLYYGWPEGAKTIFENIVGIIVATLLVFIIGLIFITIEVFK